MRTSKATKIVTAATLALFAPGCAAAQDESPEESKAKTLLATDLLGGTFNVIDGLETSAETLDQGAIKLNVSLAHQLPNPTQFPDGENVVDLRIEQGGSSVQASNFVIRVVNGEYRLIPGIVKDGQFEAAKRCNGKGKEGVPVSPGSSPISFIVWISKNQQLSSDRGYSFINQVDRKTEESVSVSRFVLRHHSGVTASVLSGPLQTYGEVMDAGRVLWNAESSACLHL